MQKTAKSKSTRSQGKTPHAALLRGINVGGKNKIPMAALAEIFTQAGCADVQTYIQSGNVVFLAMQASAKRIPKLVSKQIHEQFGFDVPVVTRTAEELHRAATKNPFLKTKEANTLHIAFLADAPTPKQVANLDPNRSKGDTFKIVGREIYMHLPNGVARTKLTNSYFDTTLDTVTTIRNWRTVLKLVEMTEAIGE